MGSTGTPPFAPEGWEAPPGKRGEIVSFFDADLRFLYASKTLPETGALLGRSLLEFLDPGVHDAVRAAVAGALTTGLPHHYTVEAPGPDGTWATYSNWVLRQSFEGSDDCVCVVTLDLSQPERTADEARRAVEESEARLRAIMTNAQAIIYLLDADGNFLLSEGRQLGLLGLRPGDVVGRNALEMYAEFPDALHSIQEPLAGREYRGITPIGELRFDVVASPYRGADGSVLGVVGMGIDVTERERERRERNESQARFRQLVELAPSAIVVLDLDAGRFVEANEAAEELFGLTHAELLQTGPWAVSPPVQPDGRTSEEAAKDVIGQAIRGERPYFEWVHRNRAGEDIPCDIWLTRLPDADRQLVLGNITDIRARKAAEAERERLSAQLQQASKMQSIGQLTGGVAHDFNNLLTVIMGNLELIRMTAEDGEGTAEVPRLADSALEASQRGSSLTHRLLAFSRKQPLQPRRVDCNRLISGMEDMLRRTLGETIEIETVTAAGLWPCAADPTQLENAVLNLAINARDAMPAGGKLTLETANARLGAEYAQEHAEVESGQYVMLAVTDTGEGMVPEVLEKVFEPFFTTKGVGEGSGLGLSMVYGFTKQSGGHVKLYSEPGQGTTVRLYLPRAGEKTLAPDTRPVLGRDPVGVGELVLVVEDDDRLRALSVEMLERLGYRTVAAGSGAAGLEQLAANPGVKLLFTDVVLPDGMSGFQLAERAVERRSGLKVLFTSGYTENAIIHHGRLDPGVELLEKPFTLKQLARRVREVLDG